MRPDNLQNKRFHRLIGVRRVANRGRRTIWLWSCDCGAHKEIDADHVKSGHTQSCGCMWAEVCVKHGHGHDALGKQTRTYKAWVNMKSRAHGVTESYRRNYTDRGISVCDRWYDFKNFLADMGECPKGLSLDRYPDNDGNYEPGNCRWATRVEQNSNKRTTLVVLVDGQKMCLAHACRRTGVLYDTAIRRVRRGMTPQEAIAA